MLSQNHTSGHRANEKLGGGRFKIAKTFLRQALGPATSAIEEVCYHLCMSGIGPGNSSASEAVLQRPTGIAGLAP